MTNRKPSPMQLNLVVRDVAASVRFYREVGLDVQEATRPEWAAHHASVVSPDGIRLEMDSLAFARQWNPGYRGETGRAGCVLFFHVASREAVDQAFEHLTRLGHPAQRAPTDAFWGARYAIVEDPDGNSIGIMSPMDPERRTPPPPPPAG